MPVVEVACKNCRKLAQSPLAEDGFSEGADNDPGKHPPSLRRKPEPRDGPRLFPKLPWIPACAGKTVLRPRADICTQSS
jgi:hypothetical protein